MLFGPSSYIHVAQEYRNFSLSLSASGRGLSLQVVGDSHFKSLNRHIPTQCLRNPSWIIDYFFNGELDYSVLFVGKNWAKFCLLSLSPLLLSSRLFILLQHLRVIFTSFFPFSKHAEALRPASVTTHAQRMQRQPQGGQRKIWCRSQLKQCKHMDVVYLHYLSQPVKMLWMRKTHTQLLPSLVCIESYYKQCMETTDKCIRTHTQFLGPQISRVSF